MTAKSIPPARQAKTPVAPRSPCQLTHRAWLEQPQTRAVFAALKKEGHAVKAVGGAVRNALLGHPVKDVDLATTALPADVMRLAGLAGLEAIPTGVEHGTVMVVSGGVPHEVTTLRRDVETFGRHARVTFTTNWAEDAARRDFTMNALYCDEEGVICDPLGGGIEDALARRVRFIGDARCRIREDYLRILRFFRFNAEYASGAPDAEGLAACAAERTGLRQLSAERVRAELLRLLGAPGAVPAVGSMERAGILSVLFPHAHVRDFARLAAIEAELGRPPSPLLRLATLAAAGPESIPPLKTRLRLSSAETHFLLRAMSPNRAFTPETPEADAKAALYRLGPEHFVAGVLAAWARSNAPPDDSAFGERLNLPARWQAPALPFAGRDVLALGVRPGPEVGRILADFENWWVAAGFPLERVLIEKKLKEIALNR